MRIYDRVLTSGQVAALYQVESQNLGASDVLDNDGGPVRFAVAATRSSEGAQVMQSRLRRPFAVDDFFPPIADLPENLTPVQFRSLYGGVGAPRYRQTVAEIESRLDRCAALASP